MTAPSPVRGPDSRWALRIGLLSDVGQARDRNEDAMTAFLPYRGEASPARGEALFLVADGMGGHEAGDMASAFVAQSVRDWFTRTSATDATESTGATDAPGAGGDGDFREALRTLLEATNRDLVELGRQEGLATGAGSTATVACLRDGRLHIAHVGDTRLYRLRGGALEQLTEDHSWVAEQRRAGLLNAEEEANHPQRHMLTECLGVGPTVRVFTVTHDVLAGDRYLLCSDGLHGPLEDGVLARILGEESDPQQAARRLVALANDRSGPDNITAVVVHVHEPAGAAEMATDVTTAAGSSMAITVPGVVRHVETLPGHPPLESSPPVDAAVVADRAAHRRALPLQAVLLVLGVIALGAAAVVGERTLRAANADSAAVPIMPADTTSDSHPSPRFVPAEGSVDSLQGRTEGGLEP